MAFTAKLETAEEEFVQGRLAAFQSLWSNADDVTLCGGFGGVACIALWDAGHLGLIVNLALFVRFVFKSALGRNVPA